MTPAWLRALLLVLPGVLLVADGATLLAWGNVDLGTLLPAALGALLLATAARWTPLSRWRRSARWRQRLWQAGWAGLALWLASLLGFWFVALRAPGVQPEDAGPVAAIVVLGAGIQDGQPRPTLAARLDAAAALAQRQPAALIAVCGGKAWDETDTEAQVMARYLQQRHGIAPERIVMEVQSTSTALNLQLVRPVLQSRGVPTTAPMALVSSDFHLPRAVRVAQRQGFPQMVAVAAPTPLSTRYNAWLREYFATLSSWVLREG